MAIPAYFQYRSRNFARPYPSNNSWPYHCMSMTSISCHFDIKSMSKGCLLTRFAARLVAPCQTCAPLELPRGGLMQEPAVHVHRAMSSLATFFLRGPRRPCLTETYPQPLPIHHHLHRIGSALPQISVYQISVIHLFRVPNPPSSTEPTTPSQNRGTRWRKARQHSRPWLHPQRQTMRKHPRIRQIFLLPRQTPQRPTMRPRLPPTKPARMIRQNLSSPSCAPSATNSRENTSAQDANSHCTSLIWS